MTLPEELPQLPHSLLPWSANILSAYQLLSNIYRNARSILRHDAADPLRVAFHIDAITSDAIPVLSAMEVEDNWDLDNGPKLSEEWLVACAEIFGHLVVILRRIAEQIRGWFVQSSFLMLDLMISLQRRRQSFHTGSCQDSPNRTARTSSQDCRSRFSARGMFKPPFS
jgi:hypothetical protein